MQIFLPITVDFKLGLLDFSAISLYLPSECDMRQSLISDFLFTLSQATTISLEHAFQLNIMGRQNEWLTVGRIVGILHRNALHILNTGSTPTFFRTRKVGDQWGFIDLTCPNSLFFYPCT